MEDMVIVNRHTVREVIITGHLINKTLIQGGIKKQQINEVLKNVKDWKIAAQTVPKSKLDFLVNVPCQGVAALIAPYERTDFDQFLEQQKEKEGLSTVLILDGLEDPHNLGSILRTADATGADGVIIPKCHSVTLTQTAAKASTGATEHVPVIRVTNSVKATDELKDSGFWVVGTEVNNVADYRSPEVDMSLATVIDSEEQGMSRLVSNKYNSYIRIPMIGYVNSLNASVATGLMMYEVFRKRHDAGEI